MEKEKNNKKITIMLLIISFIVCLFIVFYIKKTINKNNIKENPIIKENVFIFKNIEYKIPNGYSYYKNNNLFKIVNNNGDWNATVVMPPFDSLNNIDDIYNKISNAPYTPEHKLEKLKINNLNVLLYKFLNEKALIIDFFTSWGDLYQIFITYQNDNFDIESINPIIESLNNPINLDYILNNKK